MIAGVTLTEKSERKTEREYKISDYVTIRRVITVGDNYSSDRWVINRRFSEAIVLDSGEAVILAQTLLADYERE